MVTLQSLVVLMAEYRSTSPVTRMPDLLLHEFADHLSDGECRPHVALPVDGDLSSACAVTSPRRDVLPGFREFHDAIVRLAAMSVGDENIAVRRNQDIGRPIERLFGLRSHAGSTEREQQFALGTELEHLVALRG